MNIPALAVLALLLSVGNVFAGDITTSVRSGEKAPDNSDGGYFEIGLAANYYRTAEVDDTDKQEGFDMGLAFGGSYRYKGLFIEASQGSLDGFNLGYNVFSSNQWVVDLLASSFSGSLKVRENEAILADPPGFKRDIWAMNRSTFYSGTGFRATGYFGDYIFQYRLVSDTYRGNGIVSTMRLGYNQQVKNWNLHYIVSADYTSSTTNDYWYGVDAHEVNERLYQYTPGSSISFTGEVGATYPVGENWVFRSFLRYTALPDEVRKSPLTDEDHKMIFSNSISYVF